MAERVIKEEDMGEETWRQFFELCIGDCFGQLSVTMHVLQIRYSLVSLDKQYVDGTVLG